MHRNHTPVIVEPICAACLNGGGVATHGDLCEVYVVERGGGKNSESLLFVFGSEFCKLPQL